MSAAPVPTRMLGPGGPEVPVFALGSWNTWDRMTPDDAVALVHRAAEAGAAFFDVAHYDMGPHAENARTDILFGEAVRAAGLRREDYLLCGKLWLWEYPARSFADQLAVSLDRIGVESADLVVVGHRRRGLLERWWSGSTGSYLLDHIGCSLLVSRQPFSDEAFAQAMDVGKGAA